MEQVKKAATYTHAKGAREAARKVLGKEAGEGKEFTITVGEDGRFSWAPIEVAKGAIDHQDIDWDKVPVTVNVAPAPIVETQDETPAPSAAASAFGAFALGQLGNSNNSVTATKTPKAPVEKKVKVAAEFNNGVRKPNPGTLCRAVWDALDEIRAAQNGAPADSKQVKQLAIDKNWNPNNASIEFYQWRKFNGITGRAAKVA